jgi:hypothetical protein
MKYRWLGILGILLPTFLSGQTGKGPYVRIGVLRPLEGHDFEFEAGVAKHFQWHRDHKDPYVWYAWDVLLGERIGWLVFATFNHSAGSLDSAVSPLEDAADDRLTVSPHSEYMAKEIWQFLPEVSRGTGDPGPAALLEFVTVDVEPGAASAFETELKTAQPTLKEETSWYRLVTGGPVPRYLRLRIRSRLSAVIEAASDPATLLGAKSMITKTSVDLLRSQPSLTIDVAGTLRR